MKAFIEKLNIEIKIESVEDVEKLKQIFECIGTANVSDSAKTDKKVRKKAFVSMAGISVNGKRYAFEGMDEYFGDSVMIPVGKIDGPFEVFSQTGKSLGIAYEAPIGKPYTSQKMCMESIGETLRKYGIPREVHVDIPPSRS